MVEWWNAGMLECRNAGMLEWWNAGSWNAECWNAGMPECQIKMEVLIIRKNVNIIIIFGILIICDDTKKINQNRKQHLKNKTIGFKVLYTIILG